eukprot:scaffold124911_cov36-Tisochrysis_lutea.AAC.5
MHQSTYQERVAEETRAETPLGGRVAFSSRHSAFMPQKMKCGQRSERRRDQPYRDESLTARSLQGAGRLRLRRGARQGCGQGGAFFEIATRRQMAAIHCLASPHPTISSRRSLEPLRHSTRMKG